MTRCFECRVADEIREGEEVGLGQSMERSILFIPLHREPNSIEDLEGFHATIM